MSDQQPTCREVSALLERGTELSSTQRSHVESCERCTDVDASQARVSRSLSMMPAAKPPIGTADRAFRAAIAGESSISPTTFWERLLPLATPVAAAAAVAGVIALLIGGPPPIEPSAIATSADATAIELLDDGSADLELALADDLFALGDE